MSSIAKRSVAEPQPQAQPPLELPSFAAAAARALPASERLAAWTVIACWWALSRACVLVTAAIVQIVRWPHGNWYPSFTSHPFAVLGAWDGRWYRMVAAHGYLVLPGHQSDTAFFPFFPALLRAGLALGLPLDATGLIVANGCLLFALGAVYELNRLWTTEAVARRAAVYAAVFPVGYVFSMVYPESVVLLAVGAASVLGARGRWGAAAVAAAVASLTRPEGLLLTSIPLAALAIRTWRAADDRARIRALSAVAAGPAAIAGLCAYHWRLFGDPFVFSEAQRAWGRALEPDGIWRAVVELVHAPSHAGSWLFRDAAFCVLYIALLAVARRVGVPWEWIGASALVVLLPLWSGSFTSDARFGLLAIPIYTGLAHAASSRWRDYAVRASSLVLLAAGTATILLRWP